MLFLVGACLWLVTLAVACIPPTAAPFSDRPNIEALNRQSMTLPILLFSILAAVGVGPAPLQRQTETISTVEKLRSDPLSPGPWSSWAGSTHTLVRFLVGFALDRIDCRAYA